jgi:uncharacterized protein DUF1579
MGDEAQLAVLAKDVGTWDAEVVVRAGPGAPPLPSRGKSVSRLACGGRWLVTDFDNESGFEGHGVTGYDPRKGCYVSTWVDNMRTFLAVAEGSWDAEKRTMTFVYSATLPDGRTLRWREETRSVDDDTQLFRQVMPGPDGTEVETLAVTYRRRPG